MFIKFALAATAAATVGGATVYAVTRPEAAPTTMTAAATSTTTHAATATTPTGPQSMIRRSASVAAHKELASRIAAARTRRAALPDLGTAQLEHVKTYIGEAFSALRPMIAECLDNVDIGGSIKVRCNVTTEPGVGAVISSSEIIENGTTIQDPEVRECVKETIAAVELEPAEVPGEFAFETSVEMRGEPAGQD